MGSKLRERTGSILFCVTGTSINWQMGAINVGTVRVMQVTVTSFWDTLKIFWDTVTIFDLQ